MTLQSFLFVLVDQLLKGAAILLVAGLMSLVFRRASAAKRNALWFSTFAALLLLPFTQLAQPQWSWTPIPGTAFPISKQAAVLFSPVDSGAIQSPLADPAMERSWGLPGWRGLLVGFWGAGAALLIMRRIAASRQLRRLLRASEPALSGPLFSLFSEMAKRCSLTRLVCLRISPACQAPMTWGVWRPVVLLPKDAGHWHEERLRIVFGHELGHILRWDAATRLLAQVSCALHWFNPLVWIAARQLRLTQEQACDDRVLVEGVDPAAYAAALVESVWRFHHQRSGYGEALAMAQPSTLETRIGAIMDAGRARDGIGWLPVLAGVAPSHSEPPLQESPAAKASGDVRKEPIMPKESDASTVNEPARETSPKSPAPERTPHSTAAPLLLAAKGWPNLPAPGNPGILRPEQPIEITAETMSSEGGIMTATGSASFQHNGTTIAADFIRYVPETKIVLAQGAVTCVQGKNFVETAQLELNLVTGKIKMTGPSKTRVVE